MSSISASNWQKLPFTFYQNKDVVLLAKLLIGKVLVTNIDRATTAGIIIETEAYNGVVDKASHAFCGKRTTRTEIMYAAGGVSYVYLCYGIHHLFNVVTNDIDVPEAILIRGIFPIVGITLMNERLRNKKNPRTILSGPGVVSKALGIHFKKHSGVSLVGDTLFISDYVIPIEEKLILSGPRIGVDYAGEDALLPYRFYLEKKVAEGLLGNQ